MILQCALAREGDHQARHDPSVPEYMLAREGDSQKPDNGYDPSVPRCTLARQHDR